MISSSFINLCLNCWKRRSKQRCDKNTAKESQDDFGRCFMQMGAVMVQLPMFIDFPRRVMSDVLESCLSHDWGYGYLLRFGKNLPCDTDGMSSDEKRIPNISIEHLSDESVDEMRLLLKPT
jgi:hypothetical protein